MVVVCVRACVRGGRRGVCVSAHTLETSQSNRVCVITSNAEIMSNDHQHCRRTRARTHTCTLSFFPFLHTYLGQVVQVSFSASFVLCLPNTRVDTLSFFFIAFYCEKNIIWRKKKLPAERMLAGNRMYRRRDLCLLDL